MRSARAAPRKHIVSARIKPPSEQGGKKGFGHHLWKAIKRTFLNVLIVIVLLALLFFTDGFWMLKPPISLTPIDLSDVQSITPRTPKGSMKQPLAMESSPTKENFELMFVDHIFEGQVSGPESFVFYGDHSIITTTADGKVLMLDANQNKTTVLYSRCDKPVSEKHCGRPLGIELVNNRTVIFADSYHGIFSHNLETQKQGRLFPRPPDGEGEEELVLVNSTFKFLNSLQVDQDSIYFTQSSSHYHREEYSHAFLEADCTGRIMKVDRRSLEHSVVLSELCFPNGLSTDVTDTNFLIVSELSKARILRVNKQTGHFTVFTDGLPGYPDNIRTDGKGGHWIGFSAVRFSAVSEMIYERPFLRLLLKYLNSMRLMNPVNLVPPYGLVGYIDSSGKLTRLLHDPSGQGCQKVSEAAPHNGHLYIGSYHPRFRWVSKYRLRS